MNNVEKLRIMLQHWIEHNKGHMDEFEKWREVMRLEGQGAVADRLGQTVSLMTSVNEQLHQALHDMGGATHDHGGDHHHHHHGDDHHHH
jgi:hypothetical protein